MFEEDIKGDCELEYWSSSAIATAFSLLTTLALVTVWGDKSICSMAIVLGSIVAMLWCWAVHYAYMCIKSQQEELKE